MKCQYTGKESSVIDRSGNELDNGDLVLDPRGRVWEILPTEGTFLKVRIVRATEVRITPNGTAKRKTGARVEMPQRSYDVHRIVVDAIAKLNPVARARYFETLEVDCPERVKSAQQMRERKQLARTAIENASSHDRMLWGKTYSERHEIERKEQL